MTSMISVLTAIIIASLAAASALYTIVSQQRVAVLKERQQVYAAIMGSKHLRNQLFVTRFEALIYSDHHERRWKLSGSPKDSLDFSESVRWMHKSEDMLIEWSRINQSLFESVGLARAVFAPTDKLEELTHRLYKFNTPSFTSAAELQADALDKWKEDSVRQLHEFAAKEYGVPTDALLSYLDKNMRIGL